MARQDSSDPNDAIVGVYAGRASKLRAIARKSGPHDEEDVVQDAFLRALEAERSQLVDRPIQFIARIARNLVIDRLRSRGRWGLLLDAGESPDAPDDAPDQERALISSDRLRRALCIIDAMPDRRREIFLSQRLDAASHADLAKRFSVSRKTVEAEMTKAMAQLSRELGDD